jgi:excisionase family DNA binding protein
MRDSYYTTKELAEVLGITPNGVTYKRLAGHIKGLRMGRDWLYPKSQFKNEAFDNMMGNPLEKLEKL